MNGYVEFHSLGGDPIVVNVDRVDFVRRFKGGNDETALNSEKSNYVVVNRNLSLVMKNLQHGYPFPWQTLPSRFNCLIGTNSTTIEIRLVVKHTGISDARISIRRADRLGNLRRSQAAQFFRRQAV